jgi:hypothetical protein
MEILLGPKAGVFIHDLQFTISRSLRVNAGKTTSPTSDVECDDSSGGNIALNCLSNLVTLVFGIYVFRDECRWNYMPVKHEVRVRFPVAPITGP